MNKGIFNGKLRLDFLDCAVDGKWFMTVYDLNYTSKNEIIYIVLAGTLTDFASIPKGFRWLIARVGKYGKAAVLHDYLCESKTVSRKRADQLFLEAMESLGVGWLTKRMMYIGVRSYSMTFGRFKK